MRKLKPKYKTILISSGFIIYLIVALGFSTKKANIQRCTRVEVEVLDSNTNQFISAQDIDKIISKNEFEIMGYPINAINTLKIEKAIENHPSIEIANVYGNIKGSVHVRIEQREPLVRIMDNSGSSYYIDDKGFLMPLSTNYTTRVPIVTGNFSRKYIDYSTENLNTENADSLLRQIYQLSKAIKQNAFWSAMCDQIFINSKKQLTIIPKTGAEEIILGQYHNYNKDLETLSTFYKEVLPVVGWEKYKSINLQFRHQIVCKE